MGPALDKIKPNVPEKACNKEKQDIYTLPFVYRYCFGQSNTDCDYLNITDVCRNNGTQIITIPLESVPSPHDNSEDTHYMNIGLAATSCKNDNVLPNSNETDIRHESDVRQAEIDRRTSENVMADVHNAWQESDYESLTDSECGSALSACAINQICHNHKRPANEPTESKEDPISLLPIMAEVFRPEIVDSIRVAEILPYLSLHVDKEKLQCMERSSTKDAASLLLDEITASPEPGKWTTFLDALKRAGYEYIAKKLMGEIETDLTAQKRLLQIFTPHIVDNLDPKQLTDTLFAKDLISTADKEEIENKQKFENTTAATLVLLDRIPRRKDNWFSEFVVTLRDCGYKFVADEINIQECVPSHVHNDSQSQTMLKPKPCTNRQVTTVARQKSASDEEAQCLGNVCEEDNLDIDEEEKQFIREKESLMKTREEKQRKAQHVKEIASLEQDIKELENEAKEREEIKKQEALCQEKETLIKMLDKKKHLAKFQQEIKQLKTRIAEIENAGDDNLQESYISEEKSEGQDKIKTSRYIEIECPGQTSRSLAEKVELEEMMKELLRNKIVPDIIATITSEIRTVLQKPYNENNLDYYNIMHDLKSLKFESLQPAPQFQNNTLSMEARKSIEHDYDIAT